MAYNDSDRLVRRRVQRAIAALLASGTAGCFSSTWDCKSGDQPFVIEAAVQQTTLEAFAQQDEGTASWQDAQCEAFCEWFRGVPPTSITACELSLSATGTASDPDQVGDLKCEGKGPVMCEGRRPLGFVESQVAVTELGGALGVMAALEAASVWAFEELAQQLKDFGAPESLSARCLSAAQDEREHAEKVYHLASEHGGTPPQPLREPAPASLRDVALHNATEGCVNETWAAFCAHVRADRASDPELRRAFAVIATDEARHGQLAWDLHQWFEGVLAPADWAEVCEAQRAALSALPAAARHQAQSLPAALGGLSPAQAEDSAREFVAALAA